MIFLKEPPSANPHQEQKIINQKAPIMTLGGSLCDHISREAFHQLERDPILTPKEWTDLFIVALSEKESTLKIASNFLD